jgi:hypothetical protein
LVRALRAHRGVGADAALWAEDVSREYRMLLLEEGVERTREVVDAQGRRVIEVVRKGKRRKEGTGFSDDGLKQVVPATGHVALRQMLRRRVRYFTDGVVIGSRMFVNEVFLASRERFGAKRKDGARKLRGGAAAAAGVLWSLRDLRKGVD